MGGGRGGMSVHESSSLRHRNWKVETQNHDRVYYPELFIKSPLWIMDLFHLTSCLLTKTIKVSFET